MCTTPSVAHHRYHLPRHVLHSGQGLGSVTHSPQCYKSARHQPGIESVLIRPILRKHTKPKYLYVGVHAAVTGMVCVGSCNVLHKSEEV